jgi:hypothetical protein
MAAQTWSPSNEAPEPVTPGRTKKASGGRGGLSCAADWLEPKSVAFEQHLNEIDRIAGERPIERYINKATKSG